MKKTHGWAVVAALLAGCGGGGGDDTAVSANPPAGPPAAEAPTPSPGPAPAPTVDIPIPGPKPSPSPSPVTEIPPAPEPAPDPAPSPPPPAGPTISAATLSTALGYLLTGPVAPNSMATLTSPPRTTSYAWQTFHRSPQDPGTYRFGSGSTGSYGLADPASAPQSRSQLRSTTIDIRDIPGGSRWLGATMTADNVLLYKEGGFSISGDIELNRTIAQWDAVESGAPWFAQLQVQTDANSNTVFSLCWHVKLPNVIRLSCAKFDRLTAAFRGVRIVDDSYGLGAWTWETQGNEVWPPPTVPAPVPPPSVPE